MTKIIVTIPPEMYPVSGTLFQKAIPRILQSPDWKGETILGVDKNFFPIRIGKIPPRVTFDPWWLISEDSDYFLIAEDSIFSDKLEITSFIKFDGSGEIFPVNEEQKPIINSIPDQNNYPSSLISNNLVVNINKNSSIGLYAINAPIGSKLSYEFSDITTNNINFYGSYYSIDYGTTWIPYNNSPIIVPSSSYGIVFIYLPLPNNAQEDKSVFLLTLNIPDDIVYLTAEYGDNPDPAAKGEILSDFIVFSRKLPNRISGTQNNSIPYGTFNRCLNDQGLAEFYGTNLAIIENGFITYNYEFYTDIYPLCIK